MKKNFFCFVLSITLLHFGFCFTSINVEATTLPVKHSIQKVQLQIIQGRIFFRNNNITCTHLSRPCFEFLYTSGNYGPRPLWLDHTKEIILLHGQIVQQTFTHPGLHLYYLFQNSLFWKVKVNVS